MFSSVLNLTRAVIHRATTPSSWPSMESMVRLAIKLTIFAAILGGVYHFFGTEGLQVVGGLMVFYIIFTGFNDLFFKGLHILLYKQIVIALALGHAIGVVIYNGISPTDVAAYPFSAWVGIGIAAFYTVIAILPDSWLHAMFRPFMRYFVLFPLFGLKVTGEENFATAGERVILIPNHPSYLDPIFVSTVCPEKVIYAMHKGTAEKPMWSFITKVAHPFAEIYKIDMHNAMALKELAKLSKEGKTICIFPEGRIQTDGGLMIAQRGTLMVARNAKARLMPITLDGPKYSKASRMQGKMKTRFFPKIKVTVHPAIDAPEGSKATDPALLFDVMSEAQFNASPYNQQTLFEGLIESAKLNGGDTVVVQNYDDDANVDSFTYNKLLAGSDILGRKIKDLSEPGEIIGMLLPNSAGAVVTFFALQRFSRVPAILNPIMNVEQSIACATAVQMKTVLTSRRFLKKMEEKKKPELQRIIDALSDRGVNVVYLEDLKEKLSKADMMAGLVRASAWESKAKPSDPAVVIFTSGSESLPKGVVLSHSNLMANRYQMKSVIDFNPSDTILNAMPMFHSFGLLAGTLLPILEGIKTFMYPDPLDARKIPLVAYDIKATIIFGTDKFLNSYARQAHPYHFKWLRMVFAGAEKLEDTTRRMWSDKLGVRVLEGYGATETSPVISACTPMHPVPTTLYKKGNGSIVPSTVGKIIPGIEYKLEAFADHDGTTSGKLIVKGPNIMLGYLKYDNPGVLQAPEDGWYDTGDIVSIDAEGFISIIGRAKRFAKIGGEMVGLPFVDSIATTIWPGFNHVAAAVKVDEKEVVVLVTDCPDATVDDFRRYASENDIKMIFVPSKVFHVDEIPMLATGKASFSEVDAIATERMAA